jgi:hypothetical protein
MKKMNVLVIVSIVLLIMAGSVNAALIDGLYDFGNGNWHSNDGLLTASGEGPDGSWNTEYNTINEEGGASWTEENPSDGQTILYKNFTWTHEGSFNFTYDSENYSVQTVMVSEFTSKFDSSGFAGFAAPFKSNISGKVMDISTGTIFDLTGILDVEGTYYTNNENGFLLSHGGEITQISVSLHSTPVPAAVWLLGSGLIGLVGCRRKLKK